jgi:hypothetical protein
VSHASTDRRHPDRVLAPARSALRRGHHRAGDYGQISADALDDEVLANTPRMPDVANITAIPAEAQA